MSDASTGAVEVMTGEDQPARRRWLLFLLPAAGVLSLAILSFLFVDRDVAHWVHGLPRQVRDVASFITRSGDAAYTIAGILALVGLTWLVTRRFHFQRAVLPLAAIAGSGIVVNLIKITVGRYRPKALFSQNDWGFEPFTVGYLTNGFPSAHAATIMSAGSSTFSLKRCSAKSTPSAAKPTTPASPATW